MSTGYTREQQIEDLAIITATEDMLSARVIGERQAACENFAGDYVRISRYFCDYDRMTNDWLGTSSSTEVSLMFKDIAFSERISGFAMQRYVPLLKKVRVKIRSKLQRRAKKQETCLLPNVHLQTCYCARLAVQREIEKAGL